MNDDLFITINGTNLNAEYSVVEHTIRICTLKIDAAEELYDCLEEAVKKTCFYCLVGNDEDASHAGEYCPFNHKEPCMVERWKRVLKRAGKEASYIYVNVKY